MSSIRFSAPPTHLVYSWNAPPNSPATRAHPSVDSSGGQLHPIVEALSRRDYAAAHAASCDEIRMLERRPYSHAVMGDLREAGRSGDANAVKRGRTTLRRFLESQGAPRPLAEAGAILGVQAAAIEATFGFVRAMEKSWNTLGDAPGAREAAGAAKRCALVGGVEEMLHNNPVYQQVNAAAQFASAAGTFEVDAQPMLFGSSPAALARRPVPESGAQIQVHLQNRATQQPNISLSLQPPVRQVYQAPSQAFVFDENEFAAQQNHELGFSPNNAAFMPEAYALPAPPYHTHIGTSFDSHAYTVPEFDFSFEAQAYMVPEFDAWFETQAYTTPAFDPQAYTVPQFNPSFEHQAYTAPGFDASLEPQGHRSPAFDPHAFIVPAYDPQDFTVPAFNDQTYAFQTFAPHLRTITPAAAGNAVPQLDGGPNLASSRRKNARSNNMTRESIRRYTGYTPDLGAHTPGQKLGEWIIANGSMTRFQGRAQVTARALVRALRDQLIAPRDQAAILAVTGIATRSH